MTPSPSDSSPCDDNSPDGTIVGVVDCRTGVCSCRSKPMHEQKEVLRDIDTLHVTTSTTEYNNLYRVTYGKWCE
jgi:hypothetical protein